MREIEVFIDTEEIADFFMKELIQRGYAASEDELEEIADITFEYLIAKCIIDEEWEDEA
ncbi:YozD family protein [Rossellomorea sp. LjRoot5]|uniref:YozD family protein n=1 Tax=Rossellomorea sp. LjRoot5 TaxID=3342331 RepID=UPI003ED10ACD